MKGPLMTLKNNPHADQALEALDPVATSMKEQTAKGETPSEVTALKLAQTQATLALAEETRTAALAGYLSTLSAGTKAHTETEELLRERLGLPKRVRPNPAMSI